MAGKLTQCIWPGCQMMTKSPEKLCGEYDKEAGKRHSYPNYLRFLRTQTETKTNDK